MREAVGEAPLVKPEARRRREIVGFAERRIAPFAPDGKYRADRVAESRIDEHRVRSEAVHKDDQMTFAWRRAGRAKHVGSAESHGVAQLAQQPREGEVELKTKTSPVFLDELAKARIYVERR